MGSRWWRREGSSEVTVRISHQMRAWFNGPWHFGLRAWSGTVLVLGGSSRDDGDVDVGVGVEGAELVHEAAGAAVGVGFALVPAGAEVGEPVVGAGEQVPDDDEDGAGDGAPGPVAVEAPGQAAEPFAEEGVGAGGAVGGLGAVAAQVGVALSFLRLT